MKYNVNYPRQNVIVTDGAKVLATFMAADYPDGMKGAISTARKFVLLATAR